MMTPLLSLGEEEIGKLIDLAGVLQTLHAIPSIRRPYSDFHFALLAFAFLSLSRRAASSYALQMVFKLPRRQREIQRLAFRCLQRRKRDVKLLAQRGIGLHVTRSPLPHHIEGSRIDVDHDRLVPLDHPRVSSNLALHKPVPIVEHLRRLRGHFDLNVVLVRREKRKLLKQRRPGLHVSPFPHFYGFSL